MSAFDKIQDLLRSQGKKQKDLTDFLGISKNAFTDWKSGRIKSWQKYLPDIADYFGVSVDYLLGKEGYKNDLFEQDKTALSEEELKLIVAYRQHPEHQPTIKKILDIGNTEVSEVLNEALFEQIASSVKNAKNNI